MNESPLEALAVLVAERLSRREVPKRAITKAEAAESLSISVDQFERYVQPEIRVWYIGRRVLVPLAELDRYLDEHSALTLKGDG